MTSFGANLRCCRKKAGLTQEALAERLGYRRTTPISLWEHNHVFPDPKTIERLAVALECDPADLMRGVEHPYDRLRKSRVRLDGHAFLSVADRRWLEAGRALAKTDARLLRHYLATIESILELVKPGRASGDGRPRAKAPRGPVAVLQVKTPADSRAPGRAPRRPEREQDAEELSS